MIRTAKTGWNAYYHPSRECHPIVGWNEHDGSPMIVHPTTGSLAPAASFTTADGHAFSGVIDKHEEYRQKLVENFHLGARLFAAWQRNDAEALTEIYAEAEADGASIRDVAYGLLHVCDCLIHDCETRHSKNPS